MTPIDPTPPPRDADERTILKWMAQRLENVHEKQMQQEVHQARQAEKLEQLLESNTDISTQLIRLEERSMSMTNTLVEHDQRIRKAEEMAGSAARIADSNSHTLQMTTQAVQSHISTVEKTILAQDIVLKDQTSDLKLLTKSEVERASQERARAAWGKASFGILGAIALLMGGLGWYIHAVGAMSATAVSAPPPTAPTIYIVAAQPSAKP